jgi:hypothetical protein
LAIIGRIKLAMIGRIKLALIGGIKLAMIGGIKLVPRICHDRVLPIPFQFYIRGHTQKVSRRLPTATARVRSQVLSCGICGGQSDTGSGVYSEYVSFPCQLSSHLVLLTRLSSRVGTIAH